MSRGEPRIFPRFVPNTAMPPTRFVLLVGGNGIAGCFSIDALSCNRMIPAQDDEEFTILERILQAVIPVCAGINLEYYFSFVDPVGYGCGTKLPHNITSLIGVMNGAGSDLASRVALANGRNS